MDVGLVPTMVKKRKSVKARSSRKRKQTQPRKPRPLMQVLIEGPRDENERLMQRRFHKMECIFFAQHFRHFNTTPRLVRDAIRRALSQLNITQERYCSAICDLESEGAKELLNALADKVAKLNRLGRVQLEKETARVAEHFTPLAVPTSARQLTESRDFPGNCCQMCGFPLCHICYSKTPSSRVPRTGKICRTCFEQMPKARQSMYYKHTYQPKGYTETTGWNPRGSWGRCQS